MKTNFRMQIVRPYPLLGRYIGPGKENGELIVLFTEPTKGTVIHTAGFDDTPHHVGKYSVSWNPDFFERVSGTVTLENT